MNGNREQTNNYTIDGVDMNESIDNLVAYQPSPDALAQISVETNNYAADTGNVAGAVISNVIKSGTNRFRGNVFEFYRNSNMDANSWANNRSSAAKPERRQDIFGGTLGGPLVKNKLFFFGNYQGTRFDAPGSETLSVAPAAWRRGDLSSLTAHGQAIPLTGAAFRGQPDSGRAGSARSPRAHPQQHGALSAAEPDVSGVTGNFVGETLHDDHARTRADVRVDWNASAKDKIFGRFSFAEYESRNDKRAFPLLLGNLTDGAVPQPRRSTGTASSARRSSTRCWSATTRSRSSATRSTGRASATPTRRSGSPAASRFPASARSAGAAG